MVLLLGLRLGIYVCQDKTRKMKAILFETGNLETTQVSPTGWTAIGQLPTRRGEEVQHTIYTEQTRLCKAQNHENATNIMLGIILKHLRKVRE